MLAAGSGVARAAEPAVNTGFTSFMDGFGDPRGQGLTYINYARFATAGSLKDYQGKDAAAFRNPRLNLFVDVNQFLYTFKVDGWSVHPGLNLIVPFVVIDTSFGAGGASLQTNSVGLGDIPVAVYLQFDPVLYNHRPIFSHRFEAVVDLPVGTYSPTKQLNPGAYAWSLGPSWAATVVPHPLLEISTRISYLYNFANPNPGGGLSSTRAGQAIYDNFAASFEVIPFEPRRIGLLALRAGVNGYFFKEITQDQVNGVSQAGTVEQVLGIGPGAVWIPTTTDVFVFNFYWETAVRNRFASDVFQLVWARTF
jgi:hypothetical protein